LIVHVADASGVRRFASDVPAFAARLMAAFWPGPLTLILPRRSDAAAVAAGGQDSVGLRCPSHPVAQAVLQQAQLLGVCGVAAPSANLFGRVSPTTAAHVASEFGDALCVLDGGACEVGIESTIVDCTREQPVVLRPGVLTPEQLSAACGVQVLVSPALQGRLDAQAPRASGTLAAHYAPSAQVKLMTLAHIEQALAQHQPAMSAHPMPVLNAAGVTVKVAIWSRANLQALADNQHQWFAMPSSASECAHVLFAQLREFDRLGVTQIWVEMPPADALWDGIRDRLQRAAAHENAASLTK
jgi:L-threonylcarbamoyladenylate synthase